MESAGRSCSRCCCHGRSDPSAAAFDPLRSLPRLIEVCSMRKLAPPQSAVVLTLGLLACGNGDKPSSSTDFVPKQGQWEVRTSIVAVSGPMFADRALASALVGQTSTELRCFTGRLVRPAVGDPMLDGRCTYTRVADEGARVNRSATCQASGADVDTGETTGIRSHDNYDYKIVIHRKETATGALRGVVETREVGRWIGNCPKGG
jgi:hypothetical protein